jgi:hypothetical protein
MIVINAPEFFDIDDSELGVFLAGGIKGCQDWQQRIVGLLQELTDGDEGYENLVVFNPRAGVFDSKDPMHFRRQVQWEFNMLHQARIISFWFSPETVNPITLYELGYQMARLPFCNRVILIGCDPAYTKIDDVKMQTKLARWQGTIHSSLIDLGKNIKHVYDEFGEGDIDFGQLRSDFPEEV